MTVREFRLPDPGEGLVEADIVTWHVKVGDEVKINDIVVEVETSKSLVELPSPYAGRVAALLVNEGDTVDVGRPIIAIDDGVGSAPEPAGIPDEDMVPDIPAGESDEGEHAEAQRPPALAASDVVEAGKMGGSAPGGRVAVLVGYGPRTAETKRRPRKGLPDPHREEAHAQVAAGSFSTDVPVSWRADHRAALNPEQAEAIGAPLPSPGSAPATPLAASVTTLAKPPVRKLAKDLGVDLAGIAGTGQGGVITREDVEAAAIPVEREAPATPVAGTADTRIPIKGVRKATAAAMVKSAFTAPHVSEWVTCDVSAAMELLERLKARREFKDVRISPLLLVAKAVCLALQRTPELNSAWDEAAGEIVIKGTVNLGIAAATPRGLVVPNIKDAQRLSLLDLAKTINDVVTTAREGKTSPAEMSRGSFTITNVGVFGVDAGTPILNPGESGILCIGQIARRPWVVGSGADEQIVPRWVTTLTVSFDHRLADGEQGSTFLADVAQILGDPGLALLF